MTTKIFLFAETQQQALEYAKKNKFQPGKFEVLSRPSGLRAYEQPISAILIGRVERRMDYDILLEVLKEVNAEVRRIAVAV